MADVATHEAGHAWGYWSQGGTVHAVDGNSILGLCKRYDPEQNRGSVSGSFPPDLYCCGGRDKTLVALFMGGVAEGSATGTYKDMLHVIKSMAWACESYPEILSDAIGLLSNGEEIPEPKLEAFFSRHAPRFQELIDPIARKAIDALADALRAAEGGKLTGRGAVKVFERVYSEAGQAPPAAALPAALHDSRPDRGESVEKALERSISLLELIKSHLESLRPESAEDVIRSEKARDEIVRAIFNISFL